MRKRGARSDIYIVRARHARNVARSQTQSGAQGSGSKIIRERMIMEGIRSMMVLEVQTGKCEYVLCRPGRLGIVYIVRKGMYKRRSRFCAFRGGA